MLREREFYATESYFYRFLPHFKLLVFSEQEHSWLRKTKFRGNLGIGVSYRFVRTKELTIEGSEAVLPDFYISIINAKRNNLAIRPSTRLKIMIERGPLKIETINMVRPEALGRALTGRYATIPQRNNINFRSTTTIDVSVYKGLSVGTRLDFIYQTYPVLVDAKIRAYDLTFIFYIKYQLHEILPVRKMIGKDKGQ